MSDGETGRKWEPSPEQAGLLSVFQAHGYKITVGAACAAAGVGARTYYNWHDIPEFSRWWEDQSNHFFQLQIAQVHAAVFASATGKAPGSPQAQKLFYERHDRDYCPRSRAENTTIAEVAITGDHERLIQLLGRVALPVADGGAVKRDDAAGGPGAGSD